MLQKYFYVINAEHTDQARLPDLPAIERVTFYVCVVKFGSKEKLGSYDDKRCVFHFPLRLGTRFDTPMAPVGQTRRHR